MDARPVTVVLISSYRAKAAKIAQHLESIPPHVQACLYTGINPLQALSDCLHSKGQKTSRGGEWNPTTVRRLMMALNLSFS